MNFIKTFLAFAVILAATSSSFAVKTASKPGLKIEDKEKLLVLPERFYYLGQEKDYQRQLHCYVPLSGTDITTDVSVPSFTGNFIEGMWTDPATGKVFIAWEEGGMEIREIHIMEVKKNGEATQVKEITGYLPRAVNGYDTSGQCGIEIKDNYIVITEQNQPAVYTLGLKKGSLPVPSKMKINNPGLGFVKITADGVNVRQMPDAKSPKLLQEKQEYYEGTLTWEDEKKKGFIYIPCHPSKGEILPYYTSETHPNDWQPVIIVPDYSNGAIRGYVSSRFTTPVEMGKVVPRMTRPAAIPEDELFGHEFTSSEIIVPSTRYIDNGKYKGLWINIEFPGMDEEGGIFFGKQIGDVVVYYSYSPLPSYDENVFGVKKTENGLSFGKNLLAGDTYGFTMGNDIDIYKLDENGIETIYSTAIPLEWGRYLVNVDGSLREVELSY